MNLRASYFAHRNASFNMRQSICGAGTPDADQAPCTRQHRTDADVPSRDDQFFFGQRCFWCRRGSLAPRRRLAGGLTARFNSFSTAALS